MPVGPADTTEGWFVAYRRASWWPVLGWLLTAAGVVAFVVALVELLRAL